MMMSLEQVKAKSADVLIGLRDYAALAAELLIEKAYRRGVYIRLTQGLRTYDGQNELYAQGRKQAELDKIGLSHVTAKPNEIRVTNAIAGHSYHNFGVAIDFVLMVSGYDMNADADNDGEADWLEVVDVAKEIGWAWGGDWKSFKDNPHFEMTFGLTTEDFRAGKNPPATKVKALIKKLKSMFVSEEDEAMTAAEKKAFDDLQSTVKSLIDSKDTLKKSLTDQREIATKQADRIKALESLSNMACPEWAKEAVACAKKHALVDTPDGSSYDFYRLLTVLHRAGYIN